MSSRTPGSSSAPPPPRRPRPDEDALSEYLNISHRATSDDTAQDRVPVAHESVLHILEEMNGSAPIEELQMRSHLHFVDFTTVLMQLESTGQISVVGEPGQETVKTEHLAG